MQVDKMAEAMRVIAEFTCSERLKRFVETGSDRESRAQTRIVFTSDVEPQLELWLPPPDQTGHAVLTN